MRRVAESDEFQNAELDTGFIERHEHKLIPKTEAPSVADIATAAMVKAFRPPVASIDPFDLLTNWKVNQERVFFFETFLNIQRLFQHIVTCRTDCKESFPANAFPVKPEIIVFCVKTQKNSF